MSAGTGVTLPLTFRTRSPRQYHSAILFHGFYLALLHVAVNPFSITANDTPTVEAGFESTAGPYLQAHCIRCHNADELTSGIRVDHLDARLEDRHLKLWQGIQKQIADQKMPPEDEPQPSPDERRKMLLWIEQALQIARSRPTPKNGSVRRLTVAQYQNTLRELLLLDDELTETLPPDAVSRDGFLNNQETQVLSPLLVETYFDIAEQALDLALVDPESRPGIQSFRMELGNQINPNPCPDNLILGANSLLLNNADIVVTQPIPQKPFPFHPVEMQTKFRFIEGYQGNDTVRGWREYDSIYHAVFACMRGAEGYPKGLAYSTVPAGLLLRPAIPSAELFGVDSTYGPRANFKISLRELPDHGRFRVSVTAAKYNDGLLLDADTAAQPESADHSIVVNQFAEASTINIPTAGLYQVDVHISGPENKAKPHPLTLHLGEREFSGMLQQPAFLVVRLNAGEMSLQIQRTENLPVERIILTRIPNDHELARRFIVFEQRSPVLGVHLGLRRDCGSTLNPVGAPQTVSNLTPQQYYFEGAIRNFPSPDVEADNVNYLAGIREIGVRSEYTDGRDRPRLLIQAIEFEGPYYDSWPPATHRNLMGDHDPSDHSPDTARSIITRFATRAYRRPVTTAEADALMAVFRASHSAGSDFLSSVKDAFQVVLTSPQFLFLTEASQSPEPEPIDDYELASKLSYFLWNGPPDENLLTLAAAGQLRSHLDSEVSRMIASSKFERFVAVFTAQWLALEKFAVLEPDRQQFPRLTRDTRTQLQREPSELLLYLMRNNLPARDLVSADYILANEVVASYYNLADRTESGFTFVPIPHDREELGGILSQTAILAGLSDGRESNPVKRGAWVARRIVAEPPDDPPPNVPTVPEDRSLSLRQRLEQHRNQTGCLQCHAKIDPWGIPLEGFDAAGRWKHQQGDTSSTLPDRTEIANFSAFKHYLAEEHLEKVVFSVLKHLTVYATGRSLTYNELAELQLQSQDLAGQNARLQDLLRIVIHSPMFLEK